MPNLRYCKPCITLPDLFRPYPVVLCPRQFGGPIRPLCDNTEPFLFNVLCNNLEQVSPRPEALYKWSLLSVSPAFGDLFSSWPGLGTPLSSNFKEALYKF